MDPSRKTRSACNRCHAQKLRCIRKAGQLQCERCLRLGTLCRFAPRAQRGSKKAAVATLNAQEHASLSTSNSEIDLDNGIDWLMQGDLFPDSLQLFNNADVPQDKETPNILWHPGIPELEVSAIDNPLPSLTITTTHELANLSIALSDLARNLPSTHIQEGTSPKPTRPSSQGTTFIFEDLFKHTTAFTNLLKRRLDTNHNPWSDDTEATTLMLASCHSRLTEIYTTVFALIQHCLQHSKGPPRPRPDRAIVLPVVQLGSMNSPALRVDTETMVPLGKAFMYMWMIAVFSGKLWGELGDAIRGCGGYPALDLGLGPGGGERSLVRAVWVEMGERVDGLLQTIESTKALLI
ncbi:hypothetical protein BJX99DRAFT_263543 [Aspergillus californicus]